MPSASGCHASRRWDRRPPTSRGTGTGSASLIGTCKLNGVEPYAYVKATLEAIAAGHPQSRIDELLPWNFVPQDPA
ncbi:transposase domain-containing protein [Aurantimonas sp. A2-1-M11]|uniref:transposase domain-containing protein n=1 Tax=Aurantimonas sp. A2-1-M11 TaxID=3113712 RepID=UPI003FA5A662